MLVRLVNAPLAASTLLTPARERALVLTVAAVQLVNVLEFMIVMPLGPDFARALGFHVDKVGVLGAAYTGAAAVSGLVGALLLDRFDRRRALLLSMLGLVAATVLAGMASDLEHLVAARILAGVFGGPATSVSVAIVADLVPPARRGRAMALVTGSFTVSAIIGVPAALEAARLGSWSTPFFGVALLGILVVVLAAAALPPMRAHLVGAPTSGQLGRMWTLVRRPEAAGALVIMGLSMITMFSIVPNISAYVQFNAGFPREHLPRLYMCGGLAGLTLTLIAGRLTDRIGVTPVVAVSAVWVSIVLGLGFLEGRPVIHVLLFFTLFMGGSSIRNVAVQSLVSRVPPPGERAGFQSVQSAVSHLACSAGALAGTFLLHERADHSLEGMERLAVATIAATLVVPLLTRFVEHRVRARERGEVT